MKNDKGELIHAKLKVIPLKFKGYKFWVPAKNFKIEDHVKDYGHVHFERLEAFQEYCSQWVLEPYEKNKPLWDVRSFSYGKNKEESILAWKMHHSISDGLTFQKMFDSLIGRERPVFETKQTSMRGSFYKMVNN